MQWEDVFHPKLREKIFSSVKINQGTTTWLKFIYSLEVLVDELQLVEQIRLEVVQQELSVKISPGIDFPSSIWRPPRRGRVRNNPFFLANCVVVDVTSRTCFLYHAKIV